MRALAFVLAVACVVGCGGSSKPQASALSAKWTAPTMLAKVPADAPYLIAMLDPMPQAVRRQTYASLDQKMVEERDRLALDPDVDRSTLPVKDRMLLALFDELQGKDMDNWGRELGFDPNGRFVMYGLSVWPVLRVAAANEQRLRQVITNVIRKSGAPVAEHTLQGRTYWQGGDAKIAMLVSVGDGEVVFAALPTPALPQYLPIVLGLQRPPRSLNDDNRLSALIGRYRFLPTMIGYVDTKIVADILAQRAASTNTELDRPLRDAIGPVDQTCKADLDRLAAFTPRLAFGYRRLDARGMHGTLVVEMPAAVTAALQRLRVSVPDLEPGLGERALMKMGVAAKLDELLPLLKQLTHHIETKPFTCSWFTGLNGAAAQLGAMLDRPLPQPLLGFRGVSFVLQDMTKNPTNPRGRAVVVGDHASDLLSVLLKLVPGMAGTTVAPDGRPVQLPLVSLGAPASVLGYAATRVDRAAIAVGPNSATEVVAALKRPLPQRSPLFSMSFDMKRMVDLELVKPDEASGVRDVALQLEVAPEGLLLEVYGTFPGR